MESKKINQLATELAPDLSDLTIIGDPTTGISKKITLSQMASLFTGTVEEYANFAAFPLVGVADTIYIALDTNILYRWNTGTSAYVELSPNIVSSLVFNDANGFDGTINLVGSVATLTITTALTTGSVGFIGASGALLQDNANFFWDDTNNRLGINTNAPTTALDVFGSGIIGRINGTSTNNAFLGFSSAGTNKWSIGNVQSDHRFRIFSEANSAELITILQTGEFGIGIANPLTKLHIDGGATALIANLDANVSVAKSLSFRSDNSNRINLEVSGTESGSNAGADLFIRRYSDAGSLIDTPFTITRSTGKILATTTEFGILATTPILRLTDNAATGNNGSVTLLAAKSGVGYNNLNYIAYEHIFKGGGSETTFLTIDSGGAATLSISGNTNSIKLTTPTNAPTFNLISLNGSTIEGQYIGFVAGGGSNTNLFYQSGNAGSHSFRTGNGSTYTERMSITSGGNVGIGVTPSAWSAFTALQLANGVHLATYTSGVNILDLGINYYFDGTNYKYVNTDSVSSLQMRSGEFRFNTAGSGTAGANADIQEKMRLTNGGSLCINATSSGGGDPLFYVYNSDGGRTNAKFEVSIATPGFTSVIFRNPNGTVGSIAINTNSTSYNTTSDYRLKEDLKEINGLEKVCAIKIYNYKWKSCNERMDGVLAHELNDIIPYAVTGEKDAEEMQGVDYSKLVPVLIKSIQELKAEIDILKAK